MFSRFRVSGKSMEPNFYEGDYVIASKLAYLFGKPKKGDVVALRHNGMLMLKRVKRVENNKIFVAGENERSSRFLTRKEKIIGKVLLGIKKHQ